jgi:uncharacterized spore protein YtfJ
MNLEAIATQLTQVIQKEANIKAIFGEPTKLDEHTIIPVARVKITLGGGGGSGSGSTPTPGKDGDELGTALASAGGGGLGIDVQPLGFIRDGAEGATFIAIADGLLGKVEHLVRSIERTARK